MEVLRRIRTDVHCGYPERDVESTQDSVTAHLSSRPADGAAVLTEINAVFYYSTSFFEGVIENP
jgi:hypothetical protein